MDFVDFRFGGGRFPWVGLGPPQYSFPRSCSRLTYLTLAIAFVEYRC